MIQLYVTDGSFSHVSRRDLSSSSDISDVFRSVPCRPPHMDLADGFLMNMSVVNT
jgi:hypothetical protein